MTSILYYYFLKDCINALEPKYKALIDNEQNHLFLAANFFEMPTYYGLLSVHKNRDYNLNDKFNDPLKTAQLIDFLAKEIYLNDYSENYLLLLYGIITHQVLKKALDKYIEGLFTNFSINKFSRKQKLYRKRRIIKNIESLIYFERENKNYKNVNLNKEFLVYLTPEMEKLTSDIFEKVYYFSFGLKMYKTSLKRFRKYSYWGKDKLGFKKFLLDIYDVLTFFKQDNASILSNHTIVKRDYLNKNNKIWYQTKFGEDINYGYNELLEELKIKTTKVLNKITEIIFYHKHFNGSLIKLLEIENLHI